MITGIIVFIIILAVIGALLGGDSFGEAIRGGCGCLITIIIILVVMSIMFLS